MYFYWSIDFQLKGPLTFRCGSNKKYEHHKLFLFVLNHRDTDGLSIYNGAEGVSIPFYFSPSIYRIHKRLFLQINQSIRMLFCKKKIKKTKQVLLDFGNCCHNPRNPNLYIFKGIRKYESSTPFRIRSHFPLIGITPQVVRFDLKFKVSTCNPRP